MLTALDQCSLSVLVYRMDQDRIAEALNGAPAWAKVGLTMPSEKMRARAALEIANCIIEGMERPTVVTDRDQLPLPL